MGKAMGLLPSWYWPEGVQRYLAAPRVALYELAVGRWAKRYGGDTALISTAGGTDFRGLDAACAAVSAAAAAHFAGQPIRVALDVRSPVAFAPLLLGLLRCDATILVLGGGDAADPGPLLDEFAPGVLVSDGDGPTPAGVQRLAPAGFLQPPEGASAPRAATPDPSRPSIALPGRAGLAWHSQMSLMSGAMAFAVFTGIEVARRALVVRPPGSWEGIIGLFAPLQAGAAALAIDCRDDAAVAEAVAAHAPVFVWTTRDTAQGLLSPGSALAGAIRGARANLYVTTAEPFPRRLRRDLRHHLHADVLTVYGYPETGPIAASHPSWYVDDAVGIPMTGVDIIALNPRSRLPSDLPWAVLSYAEIGVQTRSLAVNAAAGDPAGAAGSDATWWSTGDFGILDANGTLFLLGRSLD